MSAEALGPRASWFRLPLQVALRKVLPVITRLVRSRPGLGSQGLEVGATRRLSTRAKICLGRVVCSPTRVAYSSWSPSGEMKA